MELGGVRFKYLRVSWPEDQQPLESLSVVAELAAGLVSPRRVWQKISGEAVAGQAGEYRYDLGGPFPFDRLRIDLPQLNSLVQLQILSRAKSDEPWRLKTRATAYRLRRDETADSVQSRAAGDSVRKRDAIQKKRAREGAEEEIFERRLDRGEHIAPDTCEHV